MLGLIITFSISSIYNEDLYSIHRENTIDSTCKFNVIRIKKEDVLCNDYGINKKYCDHYSIPEEFVIFQELGINNKIVHTIKPSKMYEESDNGKVVLADFYYTFKCNDLDNEPRLYLRIIPKSDKSKSDEFLESLFVAIVLVIIMLLIAIYFPCLLEQSNFTTGYILGSVSNNSSKKKIYCE